MASKGLDTRWTRTREGDAKTDFEKIVRNSTLLLTRLKEILEERERELNNKSFSEADFSDPNWSHKQAARLGRLAELKDLKNLIPF